MYHSLYTRIHLVFLFHSVSYIVISLEVQCYLYTLAFLNKSTAANNTLN
jgi:hypothetical protein